MQSGLQIPLVCPSCQRSWWPIHNKSNIFISYLIFSRIDAEILAPLNTLISPKWSKSVIQTSILEVQVVSTGSSPWLPTHSKQIIFEALPTHSKQIIFKAQFEPLEYMLPLLLFNRMHLQCRWLEIYYPTFPFIMSENAKNLKYIFAALADLH